MARLRPKLMRVKNCCVSGVTTTVTATVTATQNTEGFKQTVIS
jgi:hypothetical protein